MELLPDGKLVLDKDEAIFVCRDYHKKWHCAKKASSQAQHRLIQYQNKPNYIYMLAYLTRRIEKYNRICKIYEKWNNVYELIFRNKRMKNDKEACK